MNEICVTRLDLGYLITILLQKIIQINVISGFERNARSVKEIRVRPSVCPAHGGQGRADRWAATVWRVTVRARALPPVNARRWRPWNRRLAATLS